MPLDLTGVPFGRLIVIREAERRKGPSGRVKRHWLCLCACGAETVVEQSRLRSGNTRSCGCLMREVRGTQNRRHGRTRSPEWRAWAAMRDRCNNQRCPYHAGRGIKVCSRWESFENFLVDMGPRPSSLHSLDRIDGDKDYSPANCRWATRTEQNRNRRNAILIEHEGRHWRLYEIEAVTGVSQDTLKQRYYKGKRGAELFAPLKTFIENRH